MSGELVGKVSVPEELNAPGHFDAPVGPDNPAPQIVAEIHVDSDGLLWVVLVLRTEDWLDQMLEVATPDGSVQLVPRNGPEGIFDMYEVRVDVIDLSVCELVASQHTDAFLGVFLGDGLVSSIALVDAVAGASVVDIWELRLQR